LRQKKAYNQALQSELTIHWNQESIIISEKESRLRNKEKTRKEIPNARKQRKLRKKEIPE